MTHSFDTNSQDISDSTAPETAPMIYDAFYVESDAFQNYIGSHKLTDEPHLMPEAWAIVRSHAGKSALKKIHGLQKADLRNHLVLKDMPKEPNPFFERVKEIDPNAHLIVRGRLNLETDILGFTEQAVNTRTTAAYPVLSEEEAHKLFKRHEYERSSFGYQSQLKPILS